MPDGGAAPAPSDLLARAEALAPRIRADAGAIEQQRELPVALANALCDGGLFAALLPRSLGGGELDLPTYLRVVEVISAADASAGWCVNQAAVFATFCRHLPHDVARTVWSGPRSIVANGPPPGGTAVVVEGGYRLSGRWTFSSGCRHAHWLGAIAAIRDPGAEKPHDVRILLLPESDAEITDTWHVRGMLGTGSHDFEVRDRFVPAEHSISFAAQPTEPGPLYRVPVSLLFACGFASVALATARTAIDATVELASGRTPRFTNTRVREQPAMQLRMGTAEATWRAAHAYLHATVQSVWDAVVAAPEITLEQRIALRLASTHAMRQAAVATDAAYDVAGSDAIYLGHPVQRRFQDVHVMTQHVQARLSHYENVGKFVLGGEPDMGWL